MSIHARGQVTTFDFIKNVTSYYPENAPKTVVSKTSPDPLLEQITDFVKNIAEKNNPGFSLDDEIQVFLLMEKIKEKIEISSFTIH